MINDKKIIVVMPAYNAEQTLEQTYGEIPFDIVDDVAAAWGAIDKYITE